MVETRCWHLGEVEKRWMETKTHSAGEMTVIDDCLDVAASQLGLLGKWKGSELP